MSRLDGKIIIVTGSTQGVGAAIASHCAEQGAAGLVICGRNEENGKAVAGAIDQCPVEFLRADFEHVADCRKVVRHCDERFGRVDGLVNAAAITTRGTLDETSVELWDQLFAINARAPFLLTQEPCGSCGERESRDQSSTFSPSPNTVVPISYAHTVRPRVLWQRLPRMWPINCFPIESE